MIQVENMTGTSDEECGCDSWIQHWEKFSGEEEDGCSAFLCDEKSNIEGAHVYKKGDKTPYIIPLCSKVHQKMKIPFGVWEGTTFIPAIELDECGNDEQG